MPALIMRRYSAQLFRRAALMSVVLPVALAACTPSVPDSAQSYDDYVRSREAAGARSQAIVTPGFSADSIGAAIDRADGSAVAGAQVGAQPIIPQVQTAQVIGAPTGALPAVRPRGDAPAGIKTETGELIHMAGHATISDEQDFEAVKSRETIESDKARIERNRAQYTVIQPGALPVRPGETGPNIVDYALATSNPVGTQLYKRSSFGFGSPGAKCAGYASPDLAQAAFLAKGGPQKDRLGLDPDGDGYACAWDPAPFRLN